MGDERRWAVLLPAWDPVLGQLGPRADAPHPGQPLCWSCSTDLLGSRFFLAGLQMERGLLASQSVLMITLDGEILSKGRFPSAPWTHPWKGTRAQDALWQQGTFFFPCKLYLTFQRTLLHLVLGFMKKSVFNFKPW